MVREMDFVDEYYADKDLSLLKKLTLVIPTYNRNYYLSRCLWYHAHFPFGQIIVADSSPEEKKVVNRETVAKVREMFGADILYLEYEPETEKYGGDIYRKWGDAVQHVNSDYVMVTTDKQFDPPMALVESLDFLEEHGEYIATVGSEYRILDSNPKSKSIELPLYLEPCNVERTTEESDEPLVRLIDSLNKRGDSNTLLFSIMRTEYQKYNYQLLEKYNISDLLYGEISISYTPYLFGKVYFQKTIKTHLRDIIALSKEKEVKKVRWCQSTESSVSRYKFTIDDYDDSDDTKLFQEYYFSSIRGELQILNFTKPQISDLISELKKTQRLYVNSNKIIKMLKKLWINRISNSVLWVNCPSCIKQGVQSISNTVFGLSMVVEDKQYCICIDDNNEEVSIISKVIHDTYLSQVTDDSISFLR